MLNKYSLRTKFFSVCGLLACLTLVVGLTGYLAVVNVTHLYGHIVEVNFDNVRNLASMRFHASEVNRGALRLTLPGAQKQFYDDSKKAILDNTELFLKADKAYTDTVWAPGEQEIYRGVNEAWNAFSAAVSKHVALYDAASANGSQELLDHYLGGLTESRKQFNVAIANLFEFQATDAAKWEANANGTSTLAKSLSLGLSVAGLAVALLVGFFFSRALALSLREISTSIASASNQVGAAAGEVSSSGQAVASASAAQASAIEQTSASLEQMAGMVESNLRSSENATQVVEMVRRSSTEGNQAMEQLGRSMQEILESNKRIEKLVKVIEEIGEKTAIIDEIVFQTKLLSFNASVEAERAGDHGRGFAVVAQEVGNLAQMSGRAALEISAIVKDSIKSAQEIVSENKERVEKGGQLTKTAGQILKQTQENAEKMLENARQILSASKEQAAGIKQINSAMDNINRNTQSAASSAEEAAAAGEQLSAQATTMDQMVSELAAVIDGAAAQMQRVSPAPKAARTRQTTAVGGGNVVALASGRRNAPVQQSFQTSLKMAAGDSVGTPDASSTQADDAWTKL